MLWNKWIHVQTWIHSTEKVNKHSKVSHCVHNAWIKRLGALDVVVILLIQLNTFLNRNETNRSHVYLSNRTKFAFSSGAAFVWNDAKPIYILSTVWHFTWMAREKKQIVYIFDGEKSTPNLLHESRSSANLLAIMILENSATLKYNACDVWRNFSS